MSETYVNYDASKVISAEIAQGVDMIRRGWDLINRSYNAANAATDAGSDTTKLVGGDFGAATNADGAQMWTQLGTVKNLLDAQIPGGLATALASLDKGISAG